VSSVRLVPLLVVAAVLCAPAISVAAWSDDPSVNTPVVTAPNIQGSHRVIHDGHGGFFVVWQDARDRAATDFDVYAQRFDASGTPKWGANGKVICKANLFQGGPRLALDGTGGIIVTWGSDCADWSTDLYVQRFDANGNAQWSAPAVRVFNSPGWWPCGWVVSDGEGGAIMMIFDGAVNRVTAGGTLAWGDAAHPVWYSTSGNCWAPKLIADGAGGAILTWVEGDDVAIQRVDHDGDLLWNGGAPVILSDPGATDSECPRIVPDGTGGAIVAWYADRDDRVYAQRVDSNGAVQWQPDGVAVMAAGERTYSSSHGLASDGAGGAIVTWMGDDSPYNMFAQRVGASGALRWSSPTQLCTGGAYWLSTSPRKTVEDGSGGCITVWNRSTGGNDYEIIAQRVDMSGNALWDADGLLLSDVAVGIGTSPCIRLAGTGYGGAAAVWWDDRNNATTGRDVYMQGIRASGRLGKPTFPDADGDGVADDVDNCPDTANADQADADADGVGDACDDCPGTAAGDPVDEDGCSTVDEDGDGVGDDQDECPDTPSCATVDADGCPSDSDGDGVVDGCDKCPDTPSCATNIDANGCAIDSDGDGSPDGCPPAEQGCCGATGPVAPLGLAAGMLLLSRFRGFKGRTRRA